MTYAIARWFRGQAARAACLGVVLSLATGLSTMTFSQAIATTPDTASQSGIGHANPTLAFNLSRVRDTLPGLQFVDLARMLRPWVAQPKRKSGNEKLSISDLRAAGYIDAKGWPTGVPEGYSSVSAIMSWTNLAHQIERQKGRYVLQYRGKGWIDVSGDARIVERAPGRIVFENRKGRFFRVDVTATDPQDNIRDISIIAEDNLALYQAGAVFNPDWVALIADARQLRFMDWNGTNNSRLTSWDQRQTPDMMARQTVALEHMVLLSNQVGADPWFTIPHQADDTYIRNFATYVRDHLDPELRVRVEYSNEIWNQQFRQSRWVQRQAKELWGEDAPMDFHAKRAVETALIWDEVFGSEAEARLVHVLGSHAGNPNRTRRTLDPRVWREHEPEDYVDPVTVFDEVAITHYFGGATLRREDMRAELLGILKNDQIDATAWLAAKLMDPSYGQSIPFIAEKWAANAAVAHRHGLRLTAYEGGQHVHHSFSEKGMAKEDVALLRAFVIDFVRSDAMADLYRASWEAWAEIGDGPFMHFGEMAFPNKHGSWGIHESLDTITRRGSVLRALNFDRKPWWKARARPKYLHGLTRRGSAGNETLVGTKAEDMLLGGDGDDTLIPGASDDGVHGGAGRDRVVLTGDASAYQVERDGAGYRLTGPDGSNFVVDVELVVFDDGQEIAIESLV